MKNTKGQKDKQIYQCQECGFHYKDGKWAEKCQAWCKKHHSCNLEIVNHAIENQRYEQSA